MLKPRSAAQPKTGSLVLSKPSDQKASLVSKPVASTPIRSPWASLPPIEKVPPVAVLPESQDPTPRTQSTEIHPKPPSPPHAPPLEIAADSFTRSRGEGPNGVAGQLFNAQSGRYEPANTGRRGSMRKDSIFRPPSLLQRGSAGDQRGPTEPSQAFQTRSGAQQDGAQWTRRRSSVISGEGGAQARRTSISRAMANGAQGERRDSQHSQALQSPSTPSFTQGAIPSDGSSALLQSATQSPAMHHAQIADNRAAAGSPLGSRDDAVAQQKQLMKEKRELAIKRRQEEEQREEAAKKERIRLKLESMDTAPTPEKKEIGEKEPQRSIEKRPVETLESKENQTEKVAPYKESARQATQASTDTMAAPKSPPKPPLPDASGLPQQYGMMKVHGAASNHVQQHESERSQVEKTRPQASGQRTSPPTQQPSPPSLTQKPLDGERKPTSLANGTKHDEPAFNRNLDVQNPKAAQQPRQQPWNSLPNDQKALGSWGNQVNMRDPTIASTNVWGAPTRSALGNGTFERSVQRPPSKAPEQYQAPALAPIGPPKHLQQSKDSREFFKPNEVVSATSIEDFQALPTLPPIDVLAQPSRHETIGRSSSSDQRGLSQQHMNGLQSRTSLSNNEQSSRGTEQPKAGALAAWGNFHTTSAQDDALKRQQYAAKLAEEDRQGTRYEPQLPVLNETWRQVKTDGQTSQRSIVSIQSDQIVPGQAAVAMRSLERSVPLGPSAIPPVTLGGGRGSRFFPAGGRGVSQSYVAPAPFSHARGSTPPPPDSDLHPAFIGNKMHPLVNLPNLVHKPKVRLPPANLTSSSSSSAVPQTLSMQSAPQSLASNPSWQDRFNGLFGPKRPSPEMTFARPVPPAIASGFSSTKESLIAPIMQVPAAVSLPQIDLSRPIESFRADSKDVVDEEDLFTPESGSLPVTLLPPKSSGPAWGGRGQKKITPKPALPSKEVEPISKDFLFEKATMGNGGPMIFIRLMGMSLPKSKTMKRPTQSNSNERNSPRPQQIHDQRVRNPPMGSKSGKWEKSRQTSGQPQTTRKTAHDGRSKNMTHQYGSRVQQASGATAGWDSSHAL